VGVDRTGRAPEMRAVGADIVVSDLSEVAVPDGSPRPRDLRTSMPACDAPRGWALVLDGFEPELERVHAALLTLADGCVGSRGQSSVPNDTARWSAALGIYNGTGPETRLLTAPSVLAIP